MRAFWVSVRAVIWPGVRDPLPLPQGGFWEWGGSERVGNQSWTPMAEILGSGSFAFPPGVDGFFNLFQVDIQGLDALAETVAE